MSTVEQEVEDDQSDPTEVEKIHHSQYQVTSEVTAFTRGEVVNGSTDHSLTEQDGVAAVTQRSNRMPLTGKSHNSEYNCKCLNVDKENREEEEEEGEEEELFECHLGAKGQVVLWSSRRETVLSRFDFVYPSCKKNNMTVSDKDIITLDSDGDPQVLRKNHLNRKEEVLIIEHQNSTTLDLVGEQVWSGALFLADFILHNPDIFTDAHIVELASGVGLTSIIASMFAKQVTITDIDRGDILDLIRRNVERNAPFMSANVDVREIDFTNHSTIDDLQERLENVSILLAADVIYHNELTDAFLKTIVRLMSEPPNKTLYLAMEKRFVFTLEDMDSCAPCYEYLLTQLDWLSCQNLSRVEWNVTLLDTPCEQYFTYERNKHLIIFKIQSKLKM